MTAAVRRTVGQRVPSCSSAQDAESAAAGHAEIEDQARRAGAARTASIVASVSVHVATTSKTGVTVEQAQQALQHDRMIVGDDESNRHGGF